MRLALSSFVGGLNLRDSPADIAQTETPNALNWVPDQRGALRWRNGCVNVVALPGVSGKRVFIWYSEVLDLFLCVRETAGAPNNLRLYSRPGDLSGVWTDRGTMTTNLVSQVAFVDWPGATPYVVIASAGTAGAGGGTWTFDGTNLVGVTGSLSGYGLALWENRVWRVGYPSNDASGNVSRLEACKVGDPTQWGTGVGGTTVDLRIKDAARLTGLGIAGGGLVVFKKRSAYRISDPATGEPHLIDPAAGALGPNAVVPMRGRLYSWGADGLYEWSGAGAGKNVGDKCRPIFLTQTLPDEPPVGGSLGESVIFCFADDFGTVRDDLLEFSPQQGWIVLHKLASSSKDEISCFARKNNELYAAISDGDVLFKMFAQPPGTDGSDLMATAAWRTAWLRPNAEKATRLLRAQLEGMLTFGGGAPNAVTVVLRVYRDWNTSSFDDYDLTSALLNNVALYRGALVSEVLPGIVRSLGQARSFAFEFRVGGAIATGAFITNLGLDFTAVEV